MIVSMTTTTTYSIGQRIAFDRTGGLAPIYGTVVGLHRGRGRAVEAVTWQEDLEGRHCVHSPERIRPVSPDEATTSPACPLILA
jgi:hypothetical protein